MELSTENQIYSHLKNRTPAFWISSEEPGRVHDIILNKASKDNIFRLDAINGLVKFDSRKNNWTIVLAPDEDGNLGPINDLNVAFEYVSSKDGIFIIEFAHKIAEAIQNYILSLHLGYRSSFYNNNQNFAPMRLILISNEDSPPEEFTRIMPVVSHSLPDKHEVIKVIEHINSNSGEIPDFTPSRSNSLDKIASASLGLSESELTSIYFESIRSMGHISSNYVNHHKIELLKKNGILDIRKPKLTLDDIGGMDNAKNLVKNIHKIWMYPGVAKQQGIKPIRRILMVGVAGTGKSLFCEAISSTLNLELAKGGVSNSMDKWVGQSEKNIRRMFQTLKVMSPIVFWIDEFGRDMSGGESSGAVDGGTTDRVHGEFLTGLQELPEDVILVAAANRIQSLAPEMTRADRFDKIMFVGFPTFSERIKIFKIHLPEHSESVIEQLSHATDKFTGAEIKSLVNQVKFETFSDSSRSPEARDFLEFIPRMKGRMWTNHQNEVISMYKRAIIEWDWASTEQMEEAQNVIGNKSSNTVSYKGSPQKKSSVAKWGVT